MSEARSSMASDNTWLTKRMIEASLGGVRRDWCPRRFHRRPANRVLVERVDGVRADAEMFFHFALDGFAGARTGLRFRPVRF
jgi:hypothetical protein